MAVIACKFLEGMFEDMNMEQNPVTDEKEDFKEESRSVDLIIQCTCNPSFFNTSVTMFVT